MQKKIFSVFKIASLSPLLIANKIFHVTVLLLVYFCKFVTLDLTAVFVNNQHGIQRRGQDFEKFIFERLHGKDVDRPISHRQGPLLVLLTQDL